MRAGPPVLVSGRDAKPRLAGDAGSSHEGGEPDRSSAHAFGATFDNPDLIVTRAVNDGESETGPLATSWHGHQYLNPAADGAVLPILHLNGYKVANPAVLARIPDGELTPCCAGTAVAIAKSASGLGGPSRSPWP